MSRRTVVTVLAIVCLAVAAETARSLFRLDYAFYTSASDKSRGVVIARGVIQLDTIDNGDVRPRNNGT